MKAIALFSGGLDSILAIRLIQEQGIEVIAFYFNTFLHASRSKNDLDVVKNGLKQLKISLETVSAEDNFIEVIRSPKYGYGKNMNPCIDCKIHIFKQAKIYMDKIGASFLISGEVVGQRPMSQNRGSLQLIERKAEVEGLVVRPLSGQLLEPTIPEKQGWINREKLLNISGKSRKIQIALAKKYNITEYPTPAGGCLLTEASFTKRITDIFIHQEKVAIDDIKLLKIGRHVRLDKKTKLIVGRDEKDNNELIKQAKSSDYLFHIEKYPSPYVLLLGEINDVNKKLAASACKHYSNVKNQKDIKVAMYRESNPKSLSYLKPD